MCRIILIAIAIILVACGGREPPPLTVPGDEQARKYEPISCDVLCSDGWEDRDYSGQVRENIIVRKSCTRVLGGELDGGRIAVLGPIGTYHDVPADIVGAPDYLRTVRDDSTLCVRFFGQRGRGEVRVGFGVGNVEFHDVRLRGVSSSSAVYYRAESYGVHWLGGSIDCSLGVDGDGDLSYVGRRACVSIDGSSGGSFVGVKITGCGHYLDCDGIEAYRNQTEGGIPRIETPRDWLIESCEFSHVGDGIHLGARDSDIRDYWWRYYDPDGVGSAATPYGYARRWTINGPHGGINAEKSTGRVFDDGRVRQ